MTKGVSVVEAKRRFSKLLGRTVYRWRRFIIERRGKLVAALVSIGDLRLLEEKRGRR